MNNSEQPDSPMDPGEHQRARRDKLQKIEAMGVDPWGSRFDDRTYISAVRDRADEVAPRVGLRGRRGQTRPHRHRHLRMWPAPVR